MLVQERICVQVFAKRDLKCQRSEVVWYLCIVNFNIIMYHTFVASQYVLHKYTTV